MINIENNERLFRTSKYEIHRKHGRLIIDLYEVIAGCCGRTKFIAVPDLATTYNIRSYMGTGVSEEEALEECLARTKQLVSSADFPDLACDDHSPVREVFEEHLHGD